MVVGRVGRDLADRSGVARVKLAYIVDSTSSRVACVALVSTWIAFQLSMIREAFALAGRDVNPYAVFLASLPYNFYCWFTLVLLFVAIGRRFDPGPMRGVSRAGGRGRPGGRIAASPAATRRRHRRLRPWCRWRVLLAAFFAGFLPCWRSSGPLLPVTREKIVAAFGSDAGPLVMVLAGLVATLARGAAVPGARPQRAAGRPPRSAFGRGVQTMVGPVFILVAAWILGSVMAVLGTAELIAGLAAAARMPVWLLPLAIFVDRRGGVLRHRHLLGHHGPALSPGRSGGGRGRGHDPGAQATFLHVAVAAVFSGAVFGDHCSPFSDTTIVTVHLLRGRAPRPRAHPDSLRADHRGGGGAGGVPAGGARRAGVGVVGGGSGRAGGRGAPFGVENAEIGPPEIRLIR